MAIGYDSTDPNSIPAAVPAPDFALGYVDGKWPSFLAMAARFPSATHVPITALPSTNHQAATVADGERGDYSPGQAAQFAHAKLSDLVVPCLYCSLAAWPSYQQACIDINIPSSAVDWWIAAYPGNGPVLYPGSVGHQYVDRGTYDESVFLDSWQPGRSLESPVQPANPRGAIMQTAPISFRGAQQHVFQVSIGTLWHKYFDPGNVSPTNPSGWKNEPISSANGGVSGAHLTIPDQLPQVSIINNQLLVTIEDVNTTVYYFANGLLSAGWGVVALP